MTMSRQERVEAAAKDAVLARHPDAKVVTEGGSPNVYRVVAGGVAFEARMSPRAAWAAAARGLEGGPR